ncbi:MAG: twin-arginine translocase TatA/TatE family subunit [Leptospiraceae bacterium]|nr:twin-arginine translocase TatA/TatE family subunit [Leptospiraceae bacterium]
MFGTGLGMWEILAILVFILILFGGRKIPQLARDLGTGIREFRKSISGAPSQEIADESEPEERVERKSSPRKKSKSKSS